MHRHEQVALWLHSSVSRWFTPPPPLAPSCLREQNDAASPSFNDKDGSCYSCHNFDPSPLGVGFLAAVMGIRAVKGQIVKLPEHLFAAEFPEGRFIDRMICGINGVDGSSSTQPFSAGTPVCHPSLPKGDGADLVFECGQPVQVHLKALLQKGENEGALQGPFDGDCVSTMRSGDNAEVIPTGNTHRKQPSKGFDMDPLKPSFWKAMDALVKGIESASGGEGGGRRGGHGDAERCSSAGTKRDVSASAMRSPSNQARPVISSKRQSQQQRGGHSRSMSVRQQDPASRLSANSKTLKRTQSSFSTTKVVRSASMPASFSSSSLRGADVERSQRGDGPPQKRPALGRKRSQTLVDHELLPSSSVELKQCKTSVVPRESPKTLGRISVDRSASISGHEALISDHVSTSPKRPPLMESTEETPKRCSSVCIQALGHDSFNEGAVGKAAAEAAASAFQALRTRDDPVIRFAARWLAGLKDRLHASFESASPQGPGATNRNKQGGIHMQKLRILQVAKRNLKEELKDYNSSFVAAFNRPPLREDKEPLRPVYVQYHLLKEHIDHLCRKYSLPDSMAESVDLGKLPASQDISDVNGTQRAACDASAPSEFSGSRDHISVGPHTEAQRRQRREREYMLERLQREQRDLGEKLATFHIAFKEKTGRPVRLNADIAPVRNEYRRFVEVSKQIEELSRAVENSSVAK